MNYTSLMSFRSPNVTFEPRWYQFSLRTLLTTMTAACVLLGAWYHWNRRATPEELAHAQGFADGVVSGMWNPQPPDVYCGSYDPRISGFQLGESLVNDELWKDPRLYEKNRVEAVIGFLEKQPNVDRHCLAAAKKRLSQQDFALAP